MIPDSVSRGRLLILLKDREEDGGPYKSEGSDRILGVSRDDPRGSLGISLNRGCLRTHHRLG
jgi:hypothetical protein